MLTSGQIAKVCKISVRTVQFYDRTNLLKPSSISEGGRRLYTENDVVKLKIICLYKSLGFSLKEIDIALNESNHMEIRKIIKDKRNELEADVSRLKMSIQNLNVIEDLILNDYLDLNNIENLDAILIQKKNFMRSTKLTYIMLVIYVLILLFFIYMLQPIDGVKPYIIIMVTFALLIGLVNYHAHHNAYICPHCHKKFELSFLKDLITLNDNKKGKKTKCPYCHRKGWFKETYKD